MNIRLVPTLALAHGSAPRALLTGLALALAACGSTTHSAAAPSSPSISGAASPSPSVPGGAGSSPTQAAVVACPTGWLSATKGQSNDAAGHIAFTVVLTDISAETCGLEGFPLVEMSYPEPSAATGATQMDGNPPAGAPESLTPSLVMLAPGASGSFVFQYLDVPGGPQACPTSSALVITPPGATGSVALAVSVAPCGGDFYVSPIRSGTAAP
jgi:hypothetical protein